MATPNKLKRRPHNPFRIPCPHCFLKFKSPGALNAHVHTAHVETERVEEPTEQRVAELHPLLRGDIVSVSGETLYNNNIDDGPCPDPPPSHLFNHSQNPWYPFNRQIEFELGELLYVREQMPKSNINILMDLWAADLLVHDRLPPFSSADDLHHVIDSIEHGLPDWQCFKVQYSGQPTLPQAPWMGQEWEVWYRDPKVVAKKMLCEFPHAPCPFREYRAVDGSDDLTSSERVWHDFMSGDWCWQEADQIAQDPRTHGAMLCPIILGSDKTTVSVGTGNNEFYPLYMSIGNIRNEIRCAHAGSVALVGFLAIAKTDRQYSGSTVFRKFRRQLFHSSLEFIFGSFGDSFEVPEVTKCYDGHYRRVIYSLAAYIADYPEQALLASVVQGWCAKCWAPFHDLDGVGGLRTRTHNSWVLQSFNLTQMWESYGLVGDVTPFTNNFPRADIHQMLTFDLLHQLIQGTFKDHLVEWITRYLEVKHGGEAAARPFLDEIDRRLSLAPEFMGLRRFKQGRRFKQWTGDDSKALMKVYLPAIEGLVPAEIVQAVRAFLEFCYTARRAYLTTSHLDQLSESLRRFHAHRQAFCTSGVCPDGFSLPRQHSMVHYRRMVELYGAPNGLCSSITESKHIVAVKEPWRRSNRHNALGQLILTNQRLDKLAAARKAFQSSGILEHSALDNAATLARTHVEEAQEHLPDDEPRNLKDESTSDPEDKHEFDAGLNGDDSSLGLDTLEELRKDDELGDDSDDDGAIEIPHAAEIHVYLGRTTVRNLPRDLPHLANRLEPGLLHLGREFLAAQLNSEQYPEPESIPLAFVKVTIHNAAVILYHTPSDPSGSRGMKREWIRCSSSWRKQGSRCDCVLVDVDPAEAPKGLHVARLRLLLNLEFGTASFPCALIQWFPDTLEDVDPVTGMRVVMPAVDDHGAPELALIHLDSIVRGAHLMPVFGPDLLPDTIQHTQTLHRFQAFYLNHFIDHHAFDLIR